MIRIYVNETFFIDTLVTGLDGRGITGLEVKFYIFNSSTDNLVFSGVLTDVGRGCYKSFVFFSEPGNYRLLIEPPKTYESMLESIIVERRLGRKIPS